MKAGAKMLPKELPNSMVEDVAKFPAAKQSNAEVKGLTEFMLQNNIRLTSKGITRLDDIIRTTGDEISAMIKSADKGQVVSRESLNNV